MNLLGQALTTVKSIWLSTSCPNSYSIGSNTIRQMQRAVQTRKKSKI